MRWAVFALVQPALAAAWWFAALWITHGIAGVAGSRGWMQWTAFLAIAADSALVHALLLLRR